MRLVPSRTEGRAAARPGRPRRAAVVRRRAVVLADDEEIRALVEPFPAGIHSHPYRAAGARACASSPSLRSIPVQPVS